MKKGAWAVLAASLFCSAPAFAGETIVAREDEKIYFGEKSMEKYEGQYEKTYYLDLKAGTLTRTRVYDYHTRKITPDDTKYKLQDTQSFPLNAPRYGLRPVITAVGHPDPNTTEMVVIREKSIETVTNTGDQVTVARSRRLR